MVRRALLPGFVTVILLGGALASAARAAAPPVRPDLARIMNDVRSNAWIEAETLAAAQPDRLVAKLVTFYRLLAPDDATPAEISRFQAANPDWPFQAILTARWNAAVAAEPDDRAAAHECLAGTPHGAAADARCAAALRRVDRAAAARFARLAWIGGLTGAKAAADFRAKFGDLLLPATDWGRFEHLALEGKVAMAAALVPALPAGRRAAAKAWLGFARRAPDAQARYAALPEKDQAVPVVFLAALSAAADRAAELALWQAHEAEVFRQASGEARALLWSRAAYLARDLLGTGAGDAKPPPAEPAPAARGKAAYALIAGARPVGELETVRRDFLAGFIALRVLGETDVAHHWFRRLLGGSSAVISRARAYYWLAASETGTHRRDDLRRAAAYCDTFYGQQAALAAGETPARLAARIRAVRTKRATIGQQIGFAERELPQAAVLLVEMGAPRRARPFLVRAAATAPDDAGRALAARLADGLGEIPAAVAVARIAGTQGQMLIRQGWPMPPVAAPVAASVAASVDPAAGAPFGPAAILSLIRQESSFDPRARSPAGAEGLMQLMPATARMVARKTGRDLPKAGLIGDPAANIALGSAYFGMLMKRFGDSLPLAIAGYNAGPRNVDKWLADFGDPRLKPGAGGVDMLDWIEEIPFNETRNYVERVIEGIVIYRALRGAAAADPVAAAAATNAGRAATPG